MARFTALIGEIDVLERIQADLAKVASRTDDRRRHDLLDLRRQLADQIAALSCVADPVFALVSDPELARTYRARISAMRSAAALHQANWPAVRLGEAPEEYRASAQRVREANRELVTWMRATITTLDTDD